jgi:transcriptional regulator with XRE-family HTH domain
MNPVARQFGENLRRARRRADLSQEKLGFLSSLHRTEIGLLERGARIPRIDTLVKIASALGIAPDELIEGIEWTPGSASTEAGAFSFSSRSARHAALMERAAALRAGQTEEADAVALVHEARDELGRRGEPEPPGEADC